MLMNVFNYMLHFRIYSYEDITWLFLTLNIAIWYLVKSIGFRRKLTTSNNYLL